VKLLADVLSDEHTVESVDVVDSADHERHFRKLMRMPPEI